MNAAEYETMFSVERQHWWYRNLRALVHRALQTHLKEPEGCLLDAGCGTGGTMDSLSQKYRIVGLDYSNLALDLCRSRDARALTRGSIASLPFPDECFSGVVSLDVICHEAAGPPLEATKELARVTKPGGCVVINLPAYEWLRSPHDEQVHSAHRFIRSEVVDLIRNAGLELADCSHWNTILFPAIVAARFSKRFTGGGTSDLSGYRPNIGTALCGGVMRVERGILRWVRLPFGVSILAVARKPER